MFCVRRICNTHYYNNKYYIEGLSEDEFEVYKLLNITDDEWNQIDEFVDGLVEKRKEID